MMLMIINLCCSLTMAICGLWLLTEPTLPRSVRLSAALIATGGIVNEIGMVSALCHVQGFAYGDIWPGEVIINIGTSALMLRWTWRMRLRTLTPAANP